MNAREYEEMVAQELRAVGINYTIEHGGKHLIVRWKHASVDRRHVMPASPSDGYRGLANSRADVRRILRNDGYLGEEETPIVIDRPALVVRGGQVWGSSLEVASKFEKAHKDVLRSIDKTISDLGREFTERNFAPSSYTDQSGRSLRAYDLTRDGFSIVAMGFTGAKAMKWKTQYLDAFGAMEVELGRAGTEIAAKVDFLQGEVSALTDLLLDRPKVERRPRIVVTPSMMRVRRAERRARYA